MNQKITHENILFFDLDGTLVHTDYSNFLAYNQAIISVTKSNQNITYDPNNRINRSNLRITFPNLSQTEYERIIFEKENCYIEFINETKLNPPIEKILKKYHKTNQTVLVTNCRKERALTILNHFGLTENFSNSFYKESISNPKRINKYINAISHLDIQPNRVIAFENEENEIADAIEAGIKIINPII